MPNLYIICLVLAALFASTQGCFVQKLFGLHDHNDGKVMHTHKDKPRNPPRYLASPDFWVNPFGKVVPFISHQR